MTAKKKKPAPKKHPKPVARKAVRHLKPVPTVPADQIAFDRARAAFQAGSLGEATLLAERAAALNIRRADVLAFLAACWMKRGNHISALDYAERATEVEPQNAVWWDRLGLTLLEMRRFEEAKTASLRAITANSNMAEAYYHLARAEFHLSGTQAAADHLVQALTLRAELATDARREFAALAGHPALAEWLPAPEAEGAKPSRKKGKAKARPAARKRR